MEIKLLTCLSGAIEFYNVGDIIEVSDEKAKVFLQRGIATKVDEPKKGEIKTDDKNTKTAKKPPKKDSVDEDKKE